MNFLAHLLLTRPTADGWAGSLLPDLLRGAERRRWLRGDDPLAEAAAMHRRIDRLTDCHWSHQHCSALFRPRLGRFAPVVTDVAFDHLLSVRWQACLVGAMALPEHAEGSPLPCERKQFIAMVYQAMEGDQPHWPPALTDALRRMAAQDWLNAYATLDGLGRILHQMAERFSHRFERRVSLAAAVQVLEAHQGQMAEAFDVFWSDLTVALGKPVVV